MQKKQIVLVCSLCVLLHIGIFSEVLFRYNNENETSTLAPYPSFSSEDSYQTLIESLFEKKQTDHSLLGYYPQIYGPSLQATYYGLSILNALGQINPSEIASYIMSYYDETSHLFYDDYASRYLDMTTYYYPLSSLLEVNCYAILSLHLLNQLELIDISDALDFIWSCYNPNTHGFTGRPYNAELLSYHKLATADNTYFAVLTLDVLMENWNGYIQQKNEIIQFINSLQISNDYMWFHGGFYNDKDGIVDTLLPLYEPNLFSTYYCIKILQVFGMEMTVNVDNLESFLLTLYNPEHHYFKISLFDFDINYSNIVASALGLELSTLFDRSIIEEEEVKEFILNHCNSIHLWDGSTEVTYHELIDTFQVIRSLNDCDVLSDFSSSTKTQIANSLLNNYFQYRGFSLLSKDYPSMNLIHTIVSSFDLFNKVSQLSTSLSQIYSTILESFEHYPTGWYGFISYTNNNEYYVGFRSYPIVYYTLGNHVHLQEIGTIIDHKSTYLALDTLLKLFKLDDFENEVKDKLGLIQFIDYINRTQFLNGSYIDLYGGFLYNVDATRQSVATQKNKLFLEYSYYAIKSLELLAEYLELGNLTDITINYEALYSYIQNHMYESSSKLYYKPWYTDDTEIIFENTYYMVYILQALNHSDLKVDKLANYLSLNLDYSNIKNLYYAYKISDLLDLQLSFHIPSVCNLIDTIYSEQHYEFYISTQKDCLDQEILLWITDMVKHDFFTAPPIPPKITPSDDFTSGIPLAIIFLVVPGCVIGITTRQLKNGKKRF